jgi:hypothetical protein
MIGGGLTRGYWREHAMRSIGDTWRRHLRLHLLRILAAAPGYSANHVLLADVVRSLGIAATRDQVLSELQWLGDQGLLILDRLDPLTVATAGERGLDIAAGRALLPGVEPPPAA